MVGSSGTALGYTHVPFMDGSPEEEGPLGAIRELAVMPQESTIAALWWERQRLLSASSSSFSAGLPAAQPKAFPCTSGQEQLWFLRINKFGDVSGAATITIQGVVVQHAFLWTRRTGMQDLGALSGTTICYGSGTG